MRLFRNDHPFLSERTMRDIGMTRALRAALGDEGTTLAAYCGHAPTDAELAERRRFFRAVLQSDEEQAFLRAVQSHAYEIDKLKTLYHRDRETDEWYWFRRVQSYTAAIQALAAISFDDKDAHSDRFWQIVSAVRRERESAAFGRLSACLRTVCTALDAWRSTTVWMQVTHAAFTAGAWIPACEELCFSERMGRTLQRLFGDAPDEAPRPGSVAQADTFLRHLCACQPTLSQALERLMSEAKDYCYAELEILARDIRVVWCVKALLEYWREHGVPFAYATVSPTGSFAITGGVDVSLLDRVERVIPNDFCEAAAVSLLHGANSGGKTAFMRMIGLCTAFTMVGLPAPAVAMRCPTVESIRTVFTGTESLSRGRLVMEKDVLTDAMQDMNDRTLLLINEVFSSTNAQDAAALSEAVLRAVYDAGAWCLWNTHHALPSLPPEAVYATYAPLVDESGHRCYEIKKQMHASANAADIAARYGLQTEQLLARFRERGMMERGGESDAFDPVL